MQFAFSSPFSALVWLAVSLSVAAQDQPGQGHGQGSEGTVMGPVAFLWPDDRKWDAQSDNIAPCGSPAGVTNRTIFPLHQGSVALTIADEAYSVAVFVAFNNDPKTQSDFVEQIVHNVTEVDPGHQCYKLDPIPSSIKAGTNATIQMQYTAEYAGENNGKNQTFYACADVTLVENADFTLQVPCFNVTSEGFNSSAPPSTTTTPTGRPTVVTEAGGAPGLSPGAKAGIAVGVILGVGLIAGLIAFRMLRKRKSNYKAAGEYEMSPRGIKTTESASARSTEQ